MRVGQVLPWVQPDSVVSNVRPGDYVSEADEWDACPPCTATGEYDAGFSRALRAPTLMHVITNASNDLLEACPLLDEAVVGLSFVAKFLDGKNTRDRLKANCFDTPTGRQFHKHLDGWKGRVYRKRWATVSHCVVEVDSIKSILCWGWCKDGYEKSANKSTADGGVQVSKVDECITSSDWWSAITVL